MSDKPKKEKKEKKPKKEKKAKTAKNSGEKDRKKKVKICPACQAEIPKEARVCPICAAKQKTVSPILVALPMVLVLLLGAAASLFVFHFPVNPPFEIPFLSGPKFSETALGQGMELTVKQEEAMVAVLGECGFKTISQVSQITADSTTTSYAVQDVDTERFMVGTDPIMVQVENKGKIIQSISYQDSPIYNEEGVVSQITDYYMGLAERDRYMDTVLLEVKSRLDLPEIAVFPSRSHWTFTEEGEGKSKVLTVESSVTTKDGSGEKLVRPFTARFEGGKFVSVTFHDPET